jgi:membrane protein DedA with SNARE-associated domain
MLHVFMLPVSPIILPLYAHLHMSLLLAVSIEHVSQWIQTGGYFVLFGLLFTCGLGLPLPEDIPLICAGALLCKDPASWTISAVCAWCGIMGGDILLYSFGQKFGREITKVPFIGKHVTEQRIERVEQLFRRYGIGVVAISRLFAGIRGAMVVTAGTIRFNFVKFVIADGLAAIVSGGFFMILGHWIGNKLSDPGTQRFIKEFKLAFLVAGGVMALGLIGFVLWTKRHPEKVVETEAKLVEGVEKVTEKVVEKVVPKSERHDS